jgi:hypothetical protein
MQRQGRSDATYVALPLHNVIIVFAFLAVVMMMPASVIAGKAEVLAITGGMLVDGNGGPPIHDSVIVVEGSKIVAAGTPSTVTVPIGAEVIDTPGMTVMPGLFDAHVRRLIMSRGRYDYYFPKYRSRMRNGIMPASAKELLMHGVTSVWDMGGNLEDILAVRDSDKPRRSYWFALLHLRLVSAEDAAKSSVPLQHANPGRFSLGSWTRGRE